MTGIEEATRALANVTAHSFSHASEAVRAAARLCSLFPAGSRSDIGGRDAVKDPGGSWTILADEDLGFPAVAVSNDELPTYWCCMHSAHWPFMPAEESGGEA